jgi:phage repressor protein C with HTH and peptisase S24 domain
LSQKKLRSDNPAKRQTRSLYVLRDTPVFYECQEKYDYFPISRIKDLCDTIFIMLTHEKIWLAIERLAQHSGFSTSGLAKKAGLDPTSFNRSKRIGVDGKPRWPSTESVARILEATGFSMTDFIGLIETETNSNSKVTKIPLLNLSQAHKKDFFDVSGKPYSQAWDSIHFPHPFKDDDGLYALEISGTGFYPLFREGDRIIISPSSPVRRGDRVVIRTVNSKILLKEILRQTATKVEVKSLGQDENLTIFTPDEINWIARIVWVSQ